MEAKLKSSLLSDAKAGFKFNTKRIPRHRSCDVRNLLPSPALIDGERTFARSRSPARPPELQFANQLFSLCDRFAAVQALSVVPAAGSTAGP